MTTKDFENIIQNVETVTVRGKNDTGQDKGLEYNSEAALKAAHDNLRKCDTAAVIAREQFLQCIQENGYYDANKNSDISEISQRKQRYLESLYQFEKALYQLSISYAAGTISITIPAVLPHKDSKPSLAYYDPLEKMLISFINDHKSEYLQFQNEVKHGAVMAVIHSYSSRNMVKDNDNFEISSVLNLLHTYKYIQTDRGDYLDIYLTAKRERGDNHTEIILMSKEKFPIFLQKSYIE